MSVWERFGSSFIDQRLNELRDEERSLAQDEARYAKAEAEFAKADGPSPGGVVDSLNRQRYKYRRASLIDPSIMPSIGEGGYGVYRPRFSHLSNKTLKEMSLRDPIVSAIFQTRIN